MPSRKEMLALPRHDRIALMRARRLEERQRRKDAILGRERPPPPRPSDGVAPDFGGRAVIVCGGPSLARVDPYSLGWPVVVVSTAIRYERLPKPAVWVLADNPNPQHGPLAKPYWTDPSILKVCPIMRRFRPGGKNVLWVPVSMSLQQDMRMRKEGRTYMDGQLPVFRHSHKSLTFCLGWLSTVGVKDILICGCDLQVQKEPYKAYAYAPGNRRLARNKSGPLAACEKGLRHHYAPSAKRCGIRMRSWSPGGKLDSILEPFHAQRDAEVPRPQGGEPAPL